MIRPWKPTDLDECVTLFMETFGPPPWNDRWPSRERARGYLLDIAGMPGFRGLLLERGNSIAAVCMGWTVRWWSGDLYNIQEFWVDRALQRQGIGSELMNQVEGSLRDEGVQAIGLLTQARYPSAAFYEKQGFRRDPETVFMVKGLGE